MSKNTFVLSLGGSIIVPEEVDISYLKQFKKFIEAQTKKGNHFVIITGGGKVCRKYQHAARAVNKNLSNIGSDWLGIKATQLNAVLLNKIFEKNSVLVTDFNPHSKVRIRSPIAISAGFKPGSSSDFDAVAMAKNQAIKTVINMSNIDYVYDKDPKLPGAKKIEKISWAGFRKIVGSKWVPGANTPFDPTASKLAEKNSIRVIVLNGKNLKNLALALRGEKFKGTLIEK